MKGFSGIADVDLKILENLDDKNLFQACSVNKELFRICNKEPSFWRNRFIKKYGLHASEFKPVDRSWKNHYMQVFLYLQKYKKKPVKFLKNIIWGGKMENSYYLNAKDLTYGPLEKAPENIVINFWLLPLGWIRLANIDDEYYRDYFDLKPFELLPKVPRGNNEFILGLAEDPAEPGTYYPLTMTKEAVDRNLQKLNYRNL